MTTNNTIHDELVTFTLPDGRRAAGLLPVIPEDAPYQIREGIARRRITATTGVCPCGAIFDVGSPAVGEHVTVAVEHEDGCPAITTTLAKAVRRWVR